MVFLFAFLLVPVIVVMAIGYFLSAPRYKGPQSDHFNGKQFFTPGGRSAKGLFDVFKWLRTREQTPWEESTFLHLGDRPPDRIKNVIRVTFVNHSTFLIQVDGINILTDPVWSERVSPFTWAGPIRKRPPGIQFDDLPKIDVVLLSHNHYDHLDIITMKRLYERHHPLIVTTLGVGAFLKSRKISGISELDWWQKIPLKDAIEVQAVPAQHFSSRGMFDRNATLWCGFILRRPGGNIYFAGDTAYNDLIFKEIERKCSPIEVALIPIGAYKPQWFMSPIHCSPEEAVKIHIEVRAKQSIATHFGTFQLADDGKSEPVNALKVALKEKSLPGSEFIKLREGEGREF